MPEWQANPYHNSLEAVAEIALRATGARGYAFYQQSRETRPPLRIGGGGVFVPDAPAEANTVSGHVLVEYPLSTNGAISAAVVFSFETKSEATRAKPELDRFAGTLETIWVAATTETYPALAIRIADLEARLLASKIADRARGLLSDDADSDPAEVIARHVDSVLRTTQTQRILEQVLSGLEEEIQERRLVGEAKQVLRALYGVSEEQAHTRLRLLSRKSRKRLKEVAQQVINEQHLLKGKSA